ncbi:MAG: hypothetical protein AAF512_11280 [Pseudomonadota bacterium]
MLLNKISKTRIIKMKFHNKALKFKFFHQAGLAGILLMTLNTSLAAIMEVAPELVEPAEDGQCALIEALENANQTANHRDCALGDLADNTILLAPASRYVLNRVYRNSELGPNGLPTITSKMVIDGRGATITRDSQAPNFRILFVKGPFPYNESPQGVITLRDITLSNGRAVTEDVFFIAIDHTTSGGNVHNAGGKLTIKNSMITDGIASHHGGGIFNQGIFVGEQLIFASNSAGSGGGLASYLSADVRLENSIFTENLANDYGGGLYSHVYSPTLSQCTFANNIATTGPGSYTRTFNTKQSLQ